MEGLLEDALYFCPKRCRWPTSKSKRREGVWFTQPVRFTMEGQVTGESGSESDEPESEDGADECWYIEDGAIAPNQYEDEISEDEKEAEDGGDGMEVDGETDHSEEGEDTDEEESVMLHPVDDDWQAGETSGSDSDDKSFESETEEMNVSMALLMDA